MFHATGLEARLSSQLLLRGTTHPCCHVCLLKRVQQQRGDQADSTPPPARFPL